MYKRIKLDITETDNVFVAGISTPDFHEVMEQVYLDWVNNYITLEKFASAYGITTDQAAALIEIGKRGNNHE